MATMEPHEAATSTPPAQPPTEPRRRHSRWLWVSLGLCVVVAGLLVWGLSKNSDLNDAQDQLDQQAKAGSVAVSSAKSAYDDITQDLDATNEELDSTKQDVEDANAAAGKAQDEADAAKQQAAKASDKTEKAQAEADQAKAEAKAAESKLQIATDCARAYVSAIGTIFEGEDVKAQAQAVGEQLKSISADCKAAFEGS